MSELKAQSSQGHVFTWVIDDFASGGSGERAALGFALAPISGSPSQPLPRTTPSSGPRRLRWPTSAGSSRSTQVKKEKIARVLSMLFALAQAASEPWPIKRRTRSTSACICCRDSSGRCELAMSSGTRFSRTAVARLTLPLDDAFSIPGSRPVVGRSEEPKVFKTDASWSVLSLASSVGCVASARHITLVAGDGPALCFAAS
jgi:hypothetical protein